MWPVNVHSGNSKHRHYHPLHYEMDLTSLLPHRCQGPSLSFSFSLYHCYKHLTRHYCAAEAAALVIYVSQLFMHGFICSLIWIHWEIKHMKHFGSSIIRLQHLPLIVMFLWQRRWNTLQNKQSYNEPKLINTEGWISSKITKMKWYVWLSQAYKLVSD